MKTTPTSVHVLHLLDPIRNISTSAEINGKVQALHLMLLTETAALGLIRAGTDPKAGDLLKLNSVVVPLVKVELKPIAA